MHKDQPASSRQCSHYAAKLAFEMDAWDLNNAMETGDDITIVDTRSPDAYEREHIPGAINLPHRTISEASTASIDVDSLVVTYCDGIGCNASTKGALRLTELGFDVKELIGGIDWWVSEGYATHGIEVSERNTGGCGC